MSVIFLTRWWQWECREVYKHTQFWGGKVKLVMGQLWVVRGTKWSDVFTACTAAKIKLMPLKNDARMRTGLGGVVSLIF